MCRLRRFQSLPYAIYNRTLFFFFRDVPFTGIDQFPRIASLFSIHLALVLGNLLCLQRFTVSSEFWEEVQVLFLKMLPVLHVSVGFDESWILGELVPRADSPIS